MMVMPLPVQYGHLKSDRSLHASANDLYVPGALAASYDIVPTFCVLTICLCADHLRRATACCEKNVPYIMQQTTQECLITCFSLQQDDSIRLCSLHLVTDAESLVFVLHSLLQVHQFCSIGNAAFPD